MPSPWDRQPNEPMRWYKRFETYRLLGTERSLLAIYNQWRKEQSRKVATGAPLLWSTRAIEWHWQERAEAWDMENIAARRAEQAAWAEEWKRKEKDMAQRLLDRALDMLKFPLAEITRTGEDGQTTIVMPANWRASDVKQYAETASKLARLAAELNTEQVGVNVNRDELVTDIEAEIARLAGVGAAGAARAISAEADSGAADDDSQ